MLLIGTLTKVPETGWIPERVAGGTTAFIPLMEDMGITEFTPLIEEIGTDTNNPLPTVAVVVTFTPLAGYMNPLNPAIGCPLN
jgi:hypothetical protein